MKNSLLKKLFAIIVASALCTVATHAQIIYTDVKPDAKLSCSKIGCSHQYNLDLDNDGSNDFEIIVSKTQYSPSCGVNKPFSSGVSVSGLESNQVTDYPLLQLNAIINEQNTYSPNVSLGGAADYGMHVLKGCTVFKSSSPSSNGYLGLRLVKGTNTYYGWINLSVSISFNSVGFTIKDYAYNSVPNQPVLAGQTTNLNVVVTSYISGAPFCAGTNFGVPYEVEGTFNASNIFTAQLSDSTGSFANPVIIGSLKSTTAGTITAKVPSNTLTATRYRIRVISSSPSSVLYDNAFDITILHGIIKAVISADGPTQFCSGNWLSYVWLSTPSEYGFTFKWLGSDGSWNTNENQIYVTASGNYRCVVTEACGIDTSNTIIVTVTSCVTANTLKSSNAIAENKQNIKSGFINTLRSYPNPFSNSTTISFSLPQTQKVSISIFDMNGRLIKTLANAQMQPGAHQLTWNAKDEKGNPVAAGIYLIKMQAGNYVETKNILVIR